MRAFLSNNRVAVSEDDITAFIGRWPCSGLQGLRGVTFTFEEKSVGSYDLVDIHYANGNSEQWDGEALVALSNKAQEYLTKKKMESG